MKIFFKNSKENEESKIVFDDILRKNDRLISRDIIVVAVFYLLLPIILFIAGWVTPLISIPTLILLAIAMALFIKSNNRETFIFKEEIRKNLIFEILFFFVVSVCIFLIMGHGDLFPQDADWSKHHAVLYDLMNYDWPVVYDGNAMLTYYIGQYIVPAFIGKIFFHSKVVVNIAILVWNSLGLTIVFRFLCSFLKLEKFYQKILLIIFVILWGGATNLGAFIYDGSISCFKWIDVVAIRVHFAPNFDALRGAFQHVISPWIACCLLLTNKNKIENYVIIGLPLLFASTFGFVYFALILFGLLVYYFVKSEKKTDIFKKIFSLQNIFMIPTAIILLIYFWGNFASDKPSQFGFGILNFFGSAKMIKFYIIFVVVEFGLYCLFVFKKMKKDILFYIITLELLIVPFFTMGEWNDLCSRGGIPARFFLMVMCFIVLRGKKIDFRKIGICLLVLLSSINIAFQCRSILHMVKVGRDDERYIRNEYESYNGYAENPNVKIDDAYNYYTLKYDESIFYIISRK